MHAAEPEPPRQRPGGKGSNEVERRNAPGNAFSCELDQVKADHRCSFGCETEQHRSMSLVRSPPGNEPDSEPYRYEVPNQQ